MTEKQQHPITPPPELVQQWAEELFGPITAATDAQQYIATQAARWGADQELEACCEWLDKGFGDVGDFRATLRAARRPSPPSLKEQALDAWDRLRNEAWCEEIDYDLDFVRRALEKLGEPLPTTDDD